MGMFMTKPSTVKHSDDGGEFEKGRIRYGVSGMQGWRVSMEDAHIALPELTRYSNLSLFGVFDGHGGSVISEWVSRHIEHIFESELDNIECDIRNGLLDLMKNDNKLPNKIITIAEALQRTYILLDEQMASPAAKPEQRAIYDDRKYSGDNNPPRTFLQELLGGVDGQRRVLRVVEQNGNRCLQIVSFGDGNNTDETQHSENEIDSMEREEQSEDNMTSKKVEEYIEADSNSGIIPFHSDVEEINDPPIIDPADNKNLDEDIEQDDNYLDDLSDVGTCSPEHCGTTAVVAVFVPANDTDISTPYLVVANAGDSRAVLSRSGQAIALSHDHKPELPLENDRILRAHGVVENGRVDGNLNMSRTLGDLQYKNDETLKPEEQKITAFPDIRIIPLTTEDEFCILACDGIWDVVDNQLCVDIVRKKMILQMSQNQLNCLSKEQRRECFTNKDFRESKEQICSSSCLDGSTPLPPLSSIQLSKICEEICDECLAPNPVESEGIGCDNMTMMIVQLGPTLREKSTEPSVSSRIGTFIARRLEAATHALEIQKSASSSDKETSDSVTVNDYQSRKSPDAAISTTLPTVPWIPKKEFHVTLYGFGIDDGRFDNIPESR
ncbi:protein phosphatase 2C, putative [Cryptosporidium muris RN66]|uniref:Protein phosphatase 2C, putative n=1 Tax=Cryptosporidium muris (strain RN66) TaxID=441375 RepID=B6AGE2_CRYMR|nr:protein phosphatase 2C, putative [Cryptosporidium muris RN66]EEA07283.1 protein phosphatase 2C, putative [Cryptosporidium muris RN66]|eukprot:XP_002141632.1 protein phosphatase 2C [Cryptosporidium muris RN66]